MDTTLEAALRPTGNGKGDARKLRAAGRVPAVVYGKGFEPFSVDISPVQLHDLFKAVANRNAVVQLKVGNDVVPCLVREVQRHPVSREIRHVDFYRVGEAPVVVTVPVRPVGRPLGAASGGRLVTIAREVKVGCPWQKIPAAFDVDVSALDVGQYFKASMIAREAGVEILGDHDFNIFFCEGKKAPEPEAAKPADAKA